MRLLIGEGEPEPQGRKGRENEALKKERTGRRGGAEPAPGANEQGRGCGACAGPPRAQARAPEISRERAVVRAGAAAGRRVGGAGRRVEAGAKSREKRPLP